MSRQVWIAVGVLALATGCVVDDGVPDRIGSSGTLANFATYVQPVLQVGCASLDCHGQVGRPLRLYARNGLRQDVGLRGMDASNEEMLANMQAIEGIDMGTTKVEDRLMLLKPLSVAAGGLHHIGGDLWEDQNNGVYRCLHAWLRAGVSDEAGQAVCNQVKP